jgi:PAS domain S-box-containing protein
MTPADLPADEPERLRVLRELRVLDTVVDPAFVALARQIAARTGWPIAAISLVDAERQWFPATVGLDVRETPRDQSFCGHAILQPAAFEVADALDDPRFGDNPLVTGGPGIRAYASVPLSVDDRRIGTVCAIHTAPAQLDAAQWQALHELALLASALLDARLREQRWRLQEARVRAASQSGNSWLWETDDQGRLSWLSENFEHCIGLPLQHDLGRGIPALYQPHGGEHAASWPRYEAALAQREPFTELIADRPSPAGMLTLSISGVPVFSSNGRFRGYRGSATTIHARLQAQSAARRAEQLLSDALESMNAGVMISAPDGRVVQSNAAWRRSIGRAVPVEGMTWPEMVRSMVERGDYPDAVGSEEAFVQWRLGLVSEEHAQHELRWRDRWLIVNDRCLRDGSLVHLSVDITDRKRAELELARQQLQAHEAQARLGAVLAAVPDLWFVLDADGRYLECGDPKHPLLVHSWDSVRGRPFVQGVTQELADQVLPAIRRALQTGEVQCLEYELVTSGGRPGSFEARISPMSAARVLYVTRDVTQQRAAEQALKAAEERWKFALEGAGDGVWDFDEDRNVAFYSPRWKEMLGYRDDEVGNTIQEWSRRIHPDDKARVMRAIQAYRRGDTEAYETEHRLQHRDGHWLWVLDRGKIVERHADGSPRRVVGTHSDITRTKQADQALRDKQAAELANRAKSEFLSRMSHEMRTPLNAVIGFSQLMRMGADQVDLDKVHDYADHVLDAGQHLLALINDVLDLQKVEEGALTLDMGRVALDDIVARTIDLLAPMAHTRGIRFENEVPSPLWVQADAQRLRQVLLNVASNAVKYNRPGGAVRWRVHQDCPERLTLLIEDEGAGLTPDQMGRLFQPFERLGKETSAIEGTGLGLIIARSLMQAIGGDLQVTSTLGRGTCVRLDMVCDLDPATTEPAPLADDPCDAAAAPAPAGRSALRMMYVEDNRINAILFEEALRMHHGTIDLRIAEDGDEALEIAREWQPEVLVLDAHLPGMTGFEVLHQLRKLPGLARAPAYMCSADAMPEDVQRAYEAGFIGYWTKPIDIAAVVADIDQLLQSPALAG